jgi:hypothetical protein
MTASSAVGVLIRDDATYRADGLGARHDNGCRAAMPRGHLVREDTADVVVHRAVAEGMSSEPSAHVSLRGVSMGGRGGRPVPHRYGPAAALRWTFRSPAAAGRT